jgi:hypothetical protein
MSNVFCGLGVNMTDEYRCQDRSTEDRLPGIKVKILNTIYLGVIYPEIAMIWAVPVA